MRAPYFGVNGSRRRAILAEVEDYAIYNQH